MHGRVAEAPRRAQARGGERPRPPLQGFAPAAAPAAAARGRACAEPDGGPATQEASHVRPWPMGRRALLRRRRDGGGGGAGAVGEEGSGVTGGNGGDGVSSLITGQAIFRAGGGGGHSPALGNPAYALGGNGGGGDSGSYYTAKAATDGLGSSGSGGGGAYGSQPAYQCGAGGSGVVIIRYEI